jgi:hypothetical protein
MDFKQEKILLFGGGGAGKSFSTASLFKLKQYNPNMRVIYLMTERNAASGLERGLKHYNIQLEAGELITCLIKNTKVKAAFKNQANAIKKHMSVSDAVARVPDAVSSGGKEKYTYFLDVCNGLDSFKGIDYVTKEEVSIGSVADLDINDILIVDGLTPIVQSIWKSVKGDRLLSNQGDYNAVQIALWEHIDLYSMLDCSYIMLAHADKITDDIAKEEKIRVNLNAGRALAGNFLGNFGDGIYAYQRNDGSRVWATRKAGVEAIGRNLPEADGLLPDFSLYDMFITQEDRPTL